MCIRDSIEHLQGTHHVIFREAVYVLHAHIIIGLEPRKSVPAKLSGLTMPVNKRHWRKQEEHIQVMNTMKALKKQLGEIVNEGRPKGSGTAQVRVYEWRQQHPEGRKADYLRETGLDPKTIRKWWDCPPPAVRFDCLLYTSRCV